MEVIARCRVAPSLWRCDKLPEAVREKGEVLVLSPGTDLAWLVGMKGRRGPGRGDARALARICGRTGDDARIMMGLWGRSAGGGAEPFAAMDDAEEGVRWSSPNRGEADEGPARWPWLAERQRPFDATMEIVDF